LSVTLSDVTVIGDQGSLGHRLWGSRDANVLSNRRFFSNSRNFSSCLSHYNT